MNAKEFLEYVNKNAARINRYENGGDGTGGKCDCIGLIIGAWRLAGNKWPWTHGSNYAARNRVNNFRTVNGTGDLHPGDLVFKGRMPGSEGYSLPTKYKSSGDLTDYYHVGVVMSVAPLLIMHCTSVEGGIKKDGSIGKWRYAGELNLLESDTGGGENMNEYLYRAMVVAGSGKTVNMRKDADKNAKV